MDSLDEVFGSGSDKPTDEETVEETTAAEVESDVEEAEKPADETEETETQVAPETQEATKPQEDDRKGWVPVGAVIDERLKRQEYERQLNELRQQIAAQEAEKIKPSIPDPYDKPDEWTAAVTGDLEAKFQAQLWQYRRDDSDARALEKHGAEAVEAAKQWAVEAEKTNPALTAQFFQQRDPIEWLVQQHNRQSRLSEWESDPDAWALKRAQELGQLQTQTAPAVEVQKQVASNKPPRSIASMPSATKRVQQADYGFDDIFK